MRRFEKKSRRVYIFSGIGVLALILFVIFTPVPMPGALSRISSPVMRGSIGVRDFFSGFFGPSALMEDNHRLILENEMLRLENSRLLMQAMEMEAIYALLDMQSLYMELPSVGARIIRRSLGPGASGFHIDRGSESGVYENMAVFADGGLVGVVRQANRRHSVVVSISDPRFAAAGMCTRTGDFGIVWGGDGFLRMEHIGLSSGISPGDKIVTSYYSSIFPRGISIGYVESIHMSLDGLSRYAFLVPSADVAALEMVLVITKLYIAEGE